MWPWLMKQIPRISILQCLTYPLPHTPFINFKYTLCVSSNWPSATLHLMNWRRQQYPIISHIWPATLWAIACYHGKFCISHFVSINHNFIWGNCPCHGLRARACSAPNWNKYVICTCIVYTTWRRQHDDEIQGSNIGSTSNYRAIVLVKFAQHVYPAQCNRVDIDRMTTVTAACRENSVLVEFRSDCVDKLPTFYGAVVIVLWACDARMV